MIYNVTMESAFEAEKNKKAFGYTVAICAALLLLAFFITWPIFIPTQPITSDLIEINLGNNEEGWGQEQPLIKGEMSPTRERSAPQPQKNVAANDEPSRAIEPDDNAEEDAAPVTKPLKPTPKVTNIAEKPETKAVKTTKPAAVVLPPAPKPQKPKLTYNGPGNGNGNGATEDNGYKYQGNKAGGTGDAGDPTGNADSYGNTPGGKIGGPRVIGNRKIIKYYAFTGDLAKATVYATVKVSTAGTGTFMGFGKNSTTRAQAYADAIVKYLRNVQFNKSTAESTVTVQFNFTIQ